MRQELQKYYEHSTEKFKERLKIMSDAQVQAIYFRLKQKGIFK